MSWLDRFKAKSRNVVAEPGLLVAPGEHVLVSGALSVLVDDHDLRVDRNALMPIAAFALPGNRCRSYLTRGLAKIGQREVMFVLAPQGVGVTLEFEQDVLKILHLVHTLARDGRTVDFGDLTTFGENGPFGLSGCGLAYLESTEGPGPAVPQDALHALLLRPEECAAANVAGVYRAVAWIAHAYRLFPHPKFSEPTRLTAVPAGLPESLLGKLPLLKVPREANAFLRNRTLVLTLDVAVYDPLVNAFAATEQNPGFGIVTGRVPHADGRVVWLPKGGAPEIIGPSGSALSTIEGGFVILMGAQEVNEARIVEDGFFAALHADAWSALRDAIKSRAEFEIAMVGDEDRFVSRFRVEWSGNAKTMVIELKSVRLYLPNDILRQRLGNDAGLLPDYVAALHRRANSFLETAGRPAAKGILIAVGVRPNKKAKVWCDAIDGEIPGELLRELEQALGEMPAVEVKQGPIAFAIEAGLWRQTPGNFPGMPKAWVEASSASLMIPDELFKVIWPE